MFGAIPILSGFNLSDFPIHFPELGNTHLHCDTAVCMETCNGTLEVVLVTFSVKALSDSHDH